MKDWNEKAAALASLASLAIHYRDDPVHWYVRHEGVEIKDKRMLRTPGGFGDTPQAAIEDHWRELTDLASHEYVVVDAYGGHRRAVRWTGHFWKDVVEEETS